MTGRPRGLRRLRARRFVVAGVAVLGAGCSGEVGFSDPPADGGDHLRPGLTVSVGVAPEAAEVARALGWTDGVPGAEVRAHRIGTEFAWETAVTDAEGTAHLPHLVTGRYRVAVYRPLTEEESAAVGVSALASGSIVAVGAGSEHAAELVPNRTGSLVISEVYAPSPLVAELRYNFHMYFEVYNNSDRTVFLDGLGFGYVDLFDLPKPTVPCLSTAPYRKDPDGVWSHFLHRFPGGGGEHPLPPGTAAVVARDAIDHSVIDPRFPDLSHADFELIGSGDVDNPDVPNLPETGLAPWFDGHGLLFWQSRTLFLSHELDVASLERRVLIEGDDHENFRVPATHLIDVFFPERADPFQDQMHERCDGIVHASFDQLGGGFPPDPSDPSYLSTSLQRMRLPGPEGAAGRLQDTNVSAVDLVAAPATPGTIP